MHQVTMHTASGVGGYGHSTSLTCDDLRLCPLALDSGDRVGVPGKCVHVGLGPDIPHLHKQKQIKQHTPTQTPLCH